MTRALATLLAPLLLSQIPQTQPTDFAIRNGDLVVVVLRPPDDDELPNVWGLPAASLRANESWEDVVRRAGREPRARVAGGGSDAAGRGHARGRGEPAGRARRRDRGATDARGGHGAQSALEVLKAGRVPQEELSSTFGQHQKLVRRILVNFRLQIQMSRR